MAKITKEMLKELEREIKRYYKRKVTKVRKRGCLQIWLKRK